jgi:hypothetical protein
MDSLTVVVLYWYLHACYYLPIKFLLIITNTNIIFICHCSIKRFLVVRVVTKDLGVGVLNG